MIRPVTVQDTCWVGLTEGIVAKRIVQSPQAMKALVGQELGVSDWLVIT